MNNPLVLMLFVVIIIGIENTIIKRGFPFVSPLQTLPIYAVSSLVVCALAYPFRDKIGLGFEKAIPNEWPIILISGALFAIGAAAYFAAYGKGASEYLVVTALSFLPVSVAVIAFALDRQLPSRNVLIAVFLAMLAMYFLGLDKKAADAKLAEEAAAKGNVAAVASADPSAPTSSQ